MALTISFPASIFSLVLVSSMLFLSGQRVHGERILQVGKELYRESLPLLMGSCLYELQELKPHTWYEVKISYPASTPAMFSIQLKKGSRSDVELNRLRKLLNTEKLIFKTESLDDIQNQGGMYVLVTVEPEGVVAIPRAQERETILYNIGSWLLAAVFLLESIISGYSIIDSERHVVFCLPEQIFSAAMLDASIRILQSLVCDELFLGLPYQAWPVIAFAVICLVLGFIAPMFLPADLLPRKNAESEHLNTNKNS